MSFVRRVPTRPGLALAGLLIAAATGVASQKKEDPKQADKLDQAQRQEIQALIQAVDAAMGGQPPASDVRLGVRTDFLKAMEGKTFVPFIVSVESGTLKPSVALYVRVVSRLVVGSATATTTTTTTTAGSTSTTKSTTTVTSAPPPPEKRPDKKGEARATYSFEDVHFVEFKPPGVGLAPAAQPPATAPTAPKPAGKPQVTRAFAVGAGEYDVYVALRERGAASPPPPAGTSGATGAAQPAATAAAPKLVVHKQTIAVPDFWNNELNTSSIILADKVQQLTAPIAKEQQADHPYVLGTTDIVPAADSRFAKVEELNVIFLVYNPTLNAEKKPDVTVEYNFHQKTGDAEKYFNRTPPQNFSAETLPPQFDLAAGHQLVAGQSVPLATFPDGDFRLEIKVTDKIAQKTVTRDVTFAVAGS